ncbi:Fasciclin domain family [Colletotrichum higginsianum IMI 349063]|uniref:Fasciclin domain family n=1 Tax=Colletotrichum higginsianum (strain IMI 349063) TaxID=759273 RepID=A0A1B7Y8Z0_COLHI|nr:Fasciclin domain family [Colletotrichum higginsianum IMI 349063]OBR08437.1 Fasciclin domain family [Colletotrichum higginsianum IMI 349063]
MANDVFPASQASSHFPLEPVSAAVLCRRETKRRDAMRARGAVRVGCRELDEEVLLMGGFERGNVVGISSESEQMGLLMSLQTLANTLCDQGGGVGTVGASTKTRARAMIVTTQPPAAILPALRDAIRAELGVQGTAEAEVKGLLKNCLERVSVSRVFDLEGLWEVLGDLDIPPASSGAEAPSVPEQRQQQQPDEKKQTSEAVHVPEPSTESPMPSAPEEQPETIVLPELKPPRPTRTEIADSDAEDFLSSASSSSELSPPPSSIRSPTPYMEVESPKQATSQENIQEVIQEVEQERVQEESQEEPLEQNKSHPRGEEPKEPNLPDIILITHFHSLMTALFTHRNRQSAHASLQLLSSHLRYLARSLPSSPLIMLLNSTSSSKETSKSANLEDNSAQPMPPPPPPNYGGNAGGSGNKPLDPTLRSIFNPPPLNVAGYYGGSQAASRRNKPTFGLVFSQLLDMHLLCTRVPRDKEDSEKLYASVPERGPGVGGREDATEVPGPVRYVWVIEVLLDENGVWEGGSSAGAVGKARQGREQRWAAVDVRGGRVVDAFETVVERVAEVRVVGGFGGPRV